MSEKQSLEWDLVHKIMAGSATAEELQQWEMLTARQAEYADLLHLLKNVEAKQRDITSPFYATDAWEQFRTRLPRTATVAELPRHRKIFPLRKIAAVAAAIAILAGAALFLLRREQIPEHHNAARFVTYTVPGGEQKLVTLPDGSRIWINAGSVLKIPAQWNDDAPREIWLEGESFFDVQPDAARPFTVHTNQTTIEVLGTSFNVDAYDQAPVAVTVATGKVRFSAANGRSVTLVQNQLAEMTRSGELRSGPADASVYSIWREGVLRFHDEPLPEVFRTLERRFNVKVKTKGNAGTGLYCTATFARGESLENILESFRHIYGLKITRNSEEIIIQSK
ncbi:FecR family protein [Chitinophaga barathri]|nr:FecR family protein [Chitinophaga barathri]